MGAGFGITFMDWMRDLALLRSGTDSGNRRLKAPRSGILDGENFEMKSTFAAGNDGNDRKFNLSIVHHPDTWLL